MEFTGVEIFLAEHAMLTSIWMIGVAICLLLTGLLQFMKLPMINGPRRRLIIRLHSWSVTTCLIGATTFVIGFALYVLTALGPAMYASRLPTVP